MIEELCLNASKEQLEWMIIQLAEKIKEIDECAAECIIDNFSKEIYGYHFFRKSYENAVGEMQNSDGTSGPHWSVDEIKEISDSNGFSFEKNNFLDLAYVMNMLYSDYSSIFGEDLSIYLRICVAFFADPDAPDGKAYRYYEAMRPTSNNG